MGLTALPVTKQAPSRGGKRRKKEKITFKNREL